MKPFYLLLSALAVSACYPTQNDPTLAPVRVYLSSTLLSSEKELVREELPRLSALGPSFVETADRSVADVTVTSWESPDCRRIAGEAVVGGRVARIDFVCAAGIDAAEAFVGHEIGHALGMLHVCNYGDHSDGCSPTVYLSNTRQPALMSPSPFAEGDDSTLGTIAVTHPQREDLAEWLRVHPTGSL